MEEAVHVRIEVTDMKGEVVDLLANQMYELGVHRVTCNITSQVSGWYIIRVFKESQSSTRKILLE